MGKKLFAEREILRLALGLQLIAKYTNAHDEQAMGAVWAVLVCGPSPTDGRWAEEELQKMKEWGWEWKGCNAGNARWVFSTCIEFDPSLRGQEEGS